MDVRSLLANLDPLKILVEYDEDHKTCVAHCLDTGAVATGNTLDAALAVLQQVLQNDIRIATRTNSLESWFNTSAPADVRTRWLEAKTTPPESIRRIELEIPASDEGVLPKRGVQSVVRIGKTKSA